MSQKSRTKDESFLIALYNEGNKHEDSQHGFNRYEIGVLVGLQRTAVETITKLLIQCNFIKKDKDEDDQVTLTPHGLKLVKSLLEKV